MARRTSTRTRTGANAPSTAAPDTKYASIALACAILSWIPLLNLALVPLGLVFGTMGALRARTYPDQAGMIRAVVALVICGLWLVATVYAMIVFGPASLLTR